MQWIDQADLRNWADRTGAREAFPVMVRDLILASATDVSDIRHIRFPGGEAGQVRGYDGDLTMAVGYPHVPAGRSIWEFGTNRDAVGKFKSDYDTRVGDTAPETRADLTFVFVSPRSWDNPKLKLPDFLKTYRDRGDFADVWYIDGAMLDLWLQEHGAVGAKHAQLVLGSAPERGARSTDQFWDEFSNRYSPQLTEAVALAARSAQADQIITHLMGRRGPLVFVGDGPEEVSAVAVAAIRTADERSRQFLEARTLIVDSDDAGRMLGKADRYSYVLSPTVKEVGDYLSTFGPTVAALDYRPTGGNFTRLERPSVRDMTEALRTMGIDEDRAETLARKSGRSLTILQRHAHKSTFAPPAWSDDGAALIPALLAGAWDTSNPGDLSVVAGLSGGRYEDYEDGLRRYLKLQDSPIDLRAGIWRLRAPVDALVNLAHLVTRRHLEALGDAALTIFGAPPPDVAEERFGVSRSPFSSLLREGIATTLLIVAAMHAEVGLDAGIDPGTLIGDLVGSLPGLRDDARVILGLERQLTFLMEAAPRPLLSALGRLLEGDTAADVLFEETVRFGAPRSNLPDLLWALELQAWDPGFFREVALLLASLAAKDPGLRRGNRPIGSLRDIFVAWMPGTNAPLTERLAVLDEIAAVHPGVGWNLLTMLLPKAQDMKGPTQRPRYRDAGASQRETLTAAMVQETYDAVTDRVLSMLGDDVGRWVEVAQAFTTFSPERRVQFLTMLTPRAAQTDGEDRIALRRALNAVAERHARFREADWALPDPELGRLERIVASLESADPFDQARALFDERHPYLAKDYEAAQRALDERRARAVRTLAATAGAEAVVRLAETVRFQHPVALAAAVAIGDGDVLEEILGQGAPDGPAPDLSSALAGQLRGIRGAAFDQELLDLAGRLGWAPVRTASMLLHWPEQRATWELVTSLGPEAEAHFWAHRQPFRFEGSTTDLGELVSRFLAAGRALQALMAAHPREAELAWPTVEAILGGAVAEINRRGAGHELDDYYVSELFKSLRGRDDVDPLRLAQWEYAFFPLLEHQDVELAIYDRLASDPEFFVSILKDVYVADGTDPGEQESSEEERNRSSISHRILIQNSRVPGERDGILDEASLSDWVDGMLEEGRKEQRSNVVPNYIGRTLAHAAEVGDVWPPEPVARVIERLASDAVERAVMIERFNMRGVHSKPLFSGGAGERELAERNRGWAAARTAFPRTRAMLSTIADNWDADARRADEEAERDRLRFE